MVSALISSVLTQLGPIAKDEVILAICARQELDKLTQNLKLVQAVLVDADEKQVKDKAVKLWLDELKQVVYDADDLLDKWHTRDAISQRQSDVDVDEGNLKKVLSCLSSFCFLFKHAFLHYELSWHIRGINKRLDVITQQRLDFGFKYVSQTHGEPRQMTSSGVDVTKIHGREQAKEAILSRLVGESSSQGTSLRVISIVGIGGLGKTTLAKLILNETKVFKTEMWVCVSEPFNLVRVGKAISEAAGSIPDSIEWEEVSKRLRESVEGKKFLLVLDDVWTEDPSHWKDLKHALNGGAPGSRIIITTRSRSVAKNVGSSDFDIYELEKLSVDESWLVLRDIALVGKENELKKFEKLGKKIANKCKGVPLAITTLSSLLFERQTKEEWEDVLASDLWEMSEIENFFLPSFFLSYYSLPPISKQCFLYCAILPKDLQIDRNYIIKVWISQGFFGFDKKRDLERDGKNHFHILAMRSFFQDFKKDTNGNITSFKMHDLIHDFAMYLWKSEGFIAKAGDTNFDGEKIRHLFASNLDIPCILKGTKLRTLVLRLLSEVPIELFNRLSYLRTLVLRNSLFEVLPNEVEKLVHLRYLDLSRSMLLELPETVCNLYNLQVLALNGCTKLCKLPKKIGMLSDLSHLEIEDTSSLSYLPKGIAGLSSLRSLCKFIVSDVDHGCTIGDLRLLNSLRGALELKGLGRIIDESEVVRAELKKKANLQKISFHFVEEEKDFSCRMKNVLDKLEPHESLEKLEIHNYPDSQFPEWVQSHLILGNIVEMILNNCNGCKKLPAFGKLGSLKTLEMKKMGSVKRIGQEFFGFDAQLTEFPKLKTLVMEHFDELEEWEIPISKDRKIMPLLSQLELKWCKKLRTLPQVWRMEALEELLLYDLPSVKGVGVEFVGVNEGSLQDGITFPKLRELRISRIDELEEWCVPLITPCLRNLGLYSFPKLKRLPIFQGCVETLKYMTISFMESWEGQEKIVMNNSREDSSGGGDSCALRSLRITDCPKLRVVPDYMFSPSLEKLYLSYDVGVLYDHSFLALGTSCSVTKLSLRSTTQRCLPKGFDQLKTLQLVIFWHCRRLDFDLKELGQLTMLRYIEIDECPILKKRFKGDDWRTVLAHVPKIKIDIVKITNKDYKEDDLVSSSDYEEDDLLSSIDYEGDDWMTFLAHIRKIKIDIVEITNKDYEEDDLLSSSYYEEDDLS